MVEIFSEQGSGRKPVAMAPIVLTADEARDALLLGSSDLKFLLEKHNVDNDIQALLFHVGIRSIPVLATFATTTPELKDIVRDDFGVDSAASIQNRVRVANLLVAWETATTRTRKQSEIEGELQSKNLIKPMANSEYTSMIQAWEKRFWELDDDVIPARSYLEKRAELIEQDDYKAEALNTVLTRDQEDPDVLVPVWSASGSLQMRKGGQTIEEPKNAEQLRKRLKVLSLGLMFLGLRHSNRAVLQGLNPQLFEDYVTYLLGEHCYALQGKTAEGYVINGPSWNQLLVYEYQVRRKAWHLVQHDGTPFKEALKAAWKDPVVKERYLTTPVALSAATPSGKRVWEGTTGDADSGKKAKGTGRGRGKGGKGAKGGRGGGKGKGKTASERLNIASRTPDGKPICYGYNDIAIRCRQKPCRFEHCCGTCFGKHPAYACTPGNKAAAAETQGSGHGTA